MDPRGSQRMIPQRKAPAPPKYLLISNSNGEEEKIEVAAMASRLKVEPVKLPAPEKPVNAARYTSFDQPPKSYEVAVSRYKSSVDSKSESKGQPDASKGGAIVPRYVGSTFTHLPNATRREFVPPPKCPTVPRPYVPTPSSYFAEGPLLENRTASGAILGSNVKRFVDSAHVPEKLVEIPVGVDNPVKKLDDTWSACWDDQAGAVYYYNNKTGEATWLPPGST